MAAVVDPQQDITTYLEAAKAAEMQIRYVIDTHVHADHISGGRALAAATGAQYGLHTDAPVHDAFLPLHEGEELGLGNVRVTVLHTPGHTPEHISLLVTDKTRGPEPWLILTGHTLMVGDLGRTELVARAEEGARALFESVQKLKALPDYLEVYPGAFAGSVCGRSLSGKPSSTMGFERQFNKALRLNDREAFVEFMLQNVPAPPPRADEVRAVNSGLRDPAGVTS
jgi:glyoxylase-like metal-dependent hydrolase (beta-lactamase superfamily II)